MSPRKTPPAEPEFLTAAEVAAMFRVDHRTVVRWIVDERLPAVRTPGGRYLVRRTDVERLLGGGGSS